MSISSSVKWFKIIGHLSVGSFSLKLAQSQTKTVTNKEIVFEDLTQIGRTKIDDLTKTEDRDQTSQKPLYVVLNCNVLKLRVFAMVTMPVGDSISMRQISSLK